jgi:hypothetical protein
MASVRVPAALTLIDGVLAMAQQSENDPGPLGLRGTEILAAFIDNPNDNTLMFDLMENIAATENGTGLVRTAIGLSHVSMYLLVRLAQATNITEREILQEAAQFFANQ